MCPFKSLGRFTWIATCLFRSFSICCREFEKIRGKLEVARRSAKADVRSTAAAGNRMAGTGKVGGSSGGGASGGMLGDGEKAGAGVKELLFPSVYKTGAHTRIQRVPNQPIR